MKRKRRTLWLTVSLIVVLGLMILSFHQYFYEEEEPPARNLQVGDMKEDTFRAMDFGENGLREVLAWAVEQNEEPGEALAVWMTALGYDLGGVARQGLSRQRYEEWKQLLSEEADEEVRSWYELQKEIYTSLLLDLQVFPVPRNTDPACAFPSFQDDWGNLRTFGGDRHHEGCDIMGDLYPDGTYPIVSMTGGVVEKLGWLKLGGWRIGIRSDSGIYYYYAHLASYAAGLAEGDRVQPGQVIGRMGSTGYSTVEGTSGKFAVHLHVGIYIPVDGGEDISVNPYYLMRYLEKEAVRTAFYPWPSSQNESGGD
ncbi:MAG: M23 family metallopeptidase [Lachnospiraceae bacterium]|nr:M23 family metallopeptidase [Lachnospiraceae bacterium]